MDKKVAIIKPVIYYYLDKEGNRRPIDYRINDGFDYSFNEQTIKEINDYFPETMNNLYVIIDGIEFKLA
ncbi:hypothetical protein [Macrococcus armenti]|uniref:hypothetical protein n=1 Tax=Macrococcus armenti TaxID=2875764 RepID=UPI001CCED070|nr:hypothetical protein [Macrococcus armenti]UBH14883.1 hypothetical protein LAU44_08945 [Macrococcus armenti]UBH17243.1 hypothetical protein LAU39_08975 [Macrococcus armenti]UBH19508.1 hypothetical protein LAU40_08955 [Macrococcus armenti]